MAKRFIATDIWDEDWFLDMPIEYRLFWFYIFTACDHAGLFKVNIKSFCTLNKVEIIPDTALSFFNNGKERIKVLKTGIWFIEDFFVFQYGTTFNPNNKVHASIENLYGKFDLKMTSIRGLRDLKERVKDKDKDKDKDSINGKQKNFGKKFTEDNLYVILESGDKQKLGTSQMTRLKFDDIKPEEISEGYIV